MTEHKIDFRLEELLGRTPNVHIDNIPFFAQIITWELRSGVRPVTRSFAMAASRRESVEGLDNPVSLTFEVDGSDTMFSGSHEITFDLLFIREIKAISEFEILIEITDIRWFIFQGRKSFFAYNMTRLTNLLEGPANGPNNTDFDDISEPLPGAIVPDNPVKIREFFDVFSLGRYLPDSVKKNGKPYSVFEVLTKELNKLTVKMFKTTSLNIDDPSYIIENLRSEGFSLFNAIQSLLAKSRLDMAVHPDGKVYVFSIDIFDEQIHNDLVNAQSTSKIGPGALYEQELSRIRPRRVTVKFPIKREMIIKAVEHTEENILKIKDFFAFSVTDKNKSGQRTRKKVPFRFIPTELATTFDGEIVDKETYIAAINVIKVPFVPKKAKDKYRFGEVIPIVVYFEDLELSEDIVRGSWFHNHIERQIDKFLKKEGVLQVRIDPLAFKIASAIRSSYRQVFMLDPFYLDRIDSWETKRCAIFDNFSGYRNVSPVYTDYSFLPRQRQLKVTQNNFIAGDKRVISYSVEKDDISRLSPSSATIEKIGGVGLFKVVFPDDIEMSIREFVPSALEFPPEVDARGGSLKKSLLQSSSLAKGFTMEAVASFNFMFDIDPEATGDKFNNIFKYIPIEFDYSNVGDGPAAEIFSRMQEARIDFGGSFVNKDIIVNLAKSECGKFMNQFIDRIVGFVSLSGFQKVSPQGNIRSVTYRITPEEGVSTDIDARGIPFAPDIIQTLSSEAREQLYRQLNKGP